MMNDWQEFNGVAARFRRTRMRVTLTAGKDFYLNRVALEALGKPEAVRYYFDVSRSRIGIKPAPADIEQSVLVRKRDRDYGLVRAAHFCNYYGIKPENSIIFQDAHVDGDGMLVLDLKTARSIRR
jgi:hypothetical protein